MKYTLEQTREFKNWFSRQSIKPFRMRFLARFENELKTVILMTTKKFPPIYSSFDSFLAVAFASITPYVITQLFYY